MQHVRIVGVAVLAAGLAGALPCAAARAQSDTSNKIDPDAMAALDKMGAYLRTLKAFQVTGAVTTEEVTTDGQKIQSSNTTTLLAEKPGHMRVEIASDKQPRLFYYDGKSFTMWAPRLKFYATVDAPPTANELAKVLEDKYDIDLPFVDLFRWGTPESNAKAITSADDVGPATIDGVTCEQYAFRQDGMDWQVWIQQGDYPLPKKLVITTTSDEARPQHEAVYTWNLAPSFNDKAFAFTPPSDAKKITIAEADAMRANAKKKQGDK